MRNKGKILLLALTLLCCAAFAVYQYRYLRTADREPPKISMAQQELTLSVSDAFSKACPRRMHWTVM